MASMISSKMRVHDPLDVALVEVGIFIRDLLDQVPIGSWHGPPTVAEASVGSFRRNSDRAFLPSRNYAVDRCSTVRIKRAVTRKVLNLAAEIRLCSLAAGLCARADSVSRPCKLSRDSDRFVNCLSGQARVFGERLFAGAARRKSPRGEKARRGSCLPADAGDSRSVVVAFSAAPRMSPSEAPESRRAVLLDGFLFFGDLARLDRQAQTAGLGSTLVTRTSTLSPTWNARAAVRHGRATGRERRMKDFMPSYSTSMPPSSIAVTSTVMIEPRFTPRRLRRSCRRAP